MFTLSDEAAQLIRHLLGRAELPDSAGLRLTTDPERNSLVMSLETFPHESDTVVAHDGVSLFVSPTAAGRLGGSRLHAQVEDRPAFFVV